MQQKKIIRRLRTLLSGSGEGYSMEHAIFNVFVFILISFGILATIINFMIGIHWAVHILSVGGTLFMTGLYYHTRIVGVFKPYHILILLFFSTTLLAGVYFFNAGIDGPISFMFIMMMIILIMVCPSRFQAFIFFYLLFVMIGIHLYEFQFPEHTVPYTSRMDRYADVISAFTYCMTFMALTIIAFKRSYTREHRNVEIKNNELSVLYSDLLKKNEQIKVLVKELNHRVKNNLQIVSGLLSLQARRANDAVSIAALNEGKDRLMSMSLLHHKLYQEDSFNEVNLKEYMSELFRYLLDDLMEGENGIRIRDDIEDMTLASHQAVSFGLIMNEIITNIRKHAFNGCDRHPEIHMLCYREENDLILEMKDNGIGMKNPDRVNGRSSFGLELIELLVDQLEGKWTIDGSGQGTRVNIRFPITDS